MKLLALIKNTIPNKPTHIYVKYFLCVRIELPTGKYQWFRVGRKLYKAMKAHKKEYGYMPYKKLRNAYIVVPLTPYFANNKASMGIGRIIRFKYRKISSETLCCRSQFILPSALNNDFYNAYKYLKHDYSRFNQLQIFINLYNWKYKEREMVK